MTFWCVELGDKQGQNLCRIKASIVVAATIFDDAMKYVDRYCPDILTQGKVQRIFEVRNVLILWPTGTVFIVEAADPTEV